MKSTMLLLGEYNVGKTHFGAQLLGRLYREQGALRMQGAPSSLAPFDVALTRLNDGYAAAHTPAASYTETHWPIADRSGRSVDLVWPEYGGEQVRDLRDLRRMSPEWRRRVEASEGWIIMIRIHNAQVSDDVFTRPIAELGKGSKPHSEFRMSEQAKLVDFLQWLMFIRGLRTLVPNKAPKLLLLLSCWDELPASQLNETPAAVLLTRMPLVSAFVRANWEESALYVAGLSALERPLSEEKQDPEFVDRGPESFGYVVNADGSHDPDLTLAIAPLV